MREKAIQLGFYTALALLVPAAYSYGRPVKPAVRPAPTPSAAARKSAPHLHEVVPAHAAHAALRTSHARETLATAHGLKSTAASARLTATERREFAREEAKESSRGKARGKVALATNPHPLREEVVVHRAAGVQGRRQERLIAAQPEKGRPEAVARTVRPEPIAPEESQAAPVLPPVHVTHNRKQHFAADEPESVEPADDSALKPGSKAKAPAPLASARLSSGVSHPQDFDEEGSVSPAPAKGMAGASRLPGAAAPVSVPGFPAPATARPALGAPLVMTAANAPHTVPGNVAPGPNEHTLQPAPEVKAKLPSVEDEVVRTQFVPSLFNKEGQLIVPPALKGSHEILVHQNVEADREGLTRIKDDADLLRLRTRKELVALPEVPGLSVDERLPLNRRFARPWTAHFLDDLARAHYERFHTQLIVTSAVRTVEFQERLMRVNGNAAPAEGETASPHLTGQAVDLGKKGLSMTEIAWMRGYLLPLVQGGRIDVEEEFQQACFHISVYRSYAPAGTPSRQIPARSTPATALATAIR